MSRKKISITHWTLEEEERIRKALPEIKSQSGKYILSTKCKAYQSLRETMTHRTAASVNIKVRTMIEDSRNEQVREVSISTQMEVADQIMESFYGKVTYPEFRKIESHMNTLAQQPKQ